MNDHPSLNPEPKPKAKRRTYREIVIDLQEQRQVLIKRHKEEMAANMAEIRKARKKADDSDARANLARLKKATPEIQKRIKDHLDRDEQQRNLTTLRKNIKKDFK